MMEDFGDKMHRQFIEILKVLLPSALSGGAQVHLCSLLLSHLSDKQKEMVFSSFYMYLYEEVIGRVSRKLWLVIVACN